MTPTESSHTPSKSEPRLQQHGTGVTVVLFFLISGILGILPIPEELKPVDLSTQESRQAVIDRVLQKPEMRFSMDEERGEGDFELEPEPFDDAELNEPEMETLSRANDSVDAGSQEATASFVRAGMNVNKEIRRLRRMAKVLKAPGSVIENPCIRKDASTCRETALGTFFRRLDEIDRAQQKTSPEQPSSTVQARIVALGNSLIASDHVTDIVRERLTDRFGDAGRGFLLPDRLSKVAGRRVRTGRGSSSWEINTFAQKKPRMTHFGFSGSHHQSSKKGDAISWAMRGSTDATLFWLSHPGGPEIELLVDGQNVATLTTAAAEPTSMLKQMMLPAGGKTLRLLAKGKNAVIYGVSLQNQKAGVSWDTVGVPASDSKIYVQKTSKEIFKSQLAAREPSLVVAMVGGNEVRSMSFGWATLDDVRGWYASFLDRIKEAAPDASCLAVAPIDAAKATAAGARLTTRKQVAPVVAMQKEVAFEKGCAFFDLFNAMGGKGALQRFHRKGLIHDDLVHPRGKGGDILGQLFADALFDAYLTTPVPANSSGPTDPLESASKPADRRPNTPPHSDEEVQKEEERPARPLREDL